MNKTQKGITLVALIITIVVLLILAVVAITAIDDEDLIEKVNGAATKYNQSVGNETNQLGNYADVLNGYLPSGTTGGNGGTGSGEVPTVTPKVGQYVEYDISYADMYNSTSSATKTFGKTDGWRYLGKDGENHLLISTGVPMILYQYSSQSAQWWDITQTVINDKMAEGLKKNLSSIPYEKVSAGTTSTSNRNTIIGLFGDDSRTTVGDYFKVTGKTYSSSIKVRTLTLEELNRAVNSAMENVSGYAEREPNATKEGFKNIPEGNDAYGLFDLSDVGLADNYSYWLASPCVGTNAKLYVVRYNFSDMYNGSSNSGNIGVRPVVVLPSGIQFTNVDNNNVLEIKE